MPIHLAKTTGIGVPRFAIEKGDASKKTIYSHDWTDRTTWYTMAERVVDEVAEDDGDHTTYNLDNAYVIDTYHGKIPQEDFLLDGDSNSYRVTVKVNDVEKTEQDPHTASGGDYTINYAAGTVTFTAALDESDVVKVTYHYSPDDAGYSTFIVRPTTGHCLWIDMVECQFPADLVITDTMRYQVYGLVDVFAPQLIPDPYESGTLIPIGNPLVFKTMNDYFADANGAHVSYPAMGASNWRGTTQSTYILQWDYVRSTVLHGPYGMELRMTLDHDAVMTGSGVNATFYASSLLHADES
jgi:hypothetical protein